MQQSPLTNEHLLERVTQQCAVNLPMVSKHHSMQKNTISLLLIAKFWLSLYMEPYQRNPFLPFESSEYSGLEMLSTCHHVSATICIILLQPKMDNLGKAAQPAKCVSDAVVRCTPGIKALAPLDTDCVPAPMS